MPQRLFLFVGLPRCFGGLIRLLRLESFVGALQLVVIGRGDVATVTGLIGPHRLPITAHANCSVLVAQAAGHEVDSPSQARETRAS